MVGYMEVMDKMDKSRHGSRKGHSTLLQPRESPRKRKHPNYSEFQTKSAKKRKVSNSSDSLAIKTEVSLASANQEWNGMVKVEKGLLSKIKEEVKEKTFVWFDERNMDIKFFTEANMKGKTENYVINNLEKELNVSMSAYRGPSLMPLKGKQKRPQT